MTLLPDFAELSALRAMAGRKSAAALRQNTESAVTGAFHSSFRGQGLEFEEVRPYAIGDDIRAIDWRVTARTGETYTKLFREERERTVMLYIDRRAAMAFGTRGTFKSVQAAKAAALLGWRALAAKDKVGFCVFGGNEPVRFGAPSRSRGTFGAFLRMLCADNTALHDTSVADALAQTGRRLPHGSLCYIISDFSYPGENIAAQTAFLRAKHRLFAIAVDDPADSVLPTKPFRCASLFGDAMRVSPHQAGRKHYEAQWHDTRETVQRAFGTRMIAVQTSDSIDAVL